MITLRGVVPIALLFLFSACQAQVMQSATFPAQELESTRYKAAISDLPAAQVEISVTLNALSNEEKALQREALARGYTAFGRAILQAAGNVDTPAQTGSVHVSVTSPAALALRTEVRLNSPGSYRIAAWGSGDASAVVMESNVTIANANLVWTPLTLGATQNLSITKLGTDNEVWTVSAERLSHFFSDVMSAANTNVSKLYGDGLAAPCQVDLVCELDLLSPKDQQTVLGQSRAVTLLVLTYSDGSSGTCTGTLLNTASAPTGVIITANHCVAGDDGSKDLTSLTTVWFFARSVCGSSALGPYVQLVTTGRVLWHNLELDGALLQIDQLPPSGVSYAGWDANQIVAADTLAFVVHHPRGDVKKGSLAEIEGLYRAPLQVGPVTYAPNTFYLIDWDAGIVEHGSSGSGLFTEDATTGNLLLRGTLTAGSVTCSQTKAAAFYSSLANMYSYISDYLNKPLSGSGGTPPPPAGKVSVVEYYNASFDHYFITPVPGEIAALGKPPFQDWQPTGNAFNAYASTSSTAGAVSVCRFFNTSFAPKSSHFYALRGLGCETTLALFPDWGLESDNLFKMRLPDGNGNCPSGSSPVYRLYNNGMGGAPNHRFVTSLSIRQAMLNKGYASEGFGALGVGMCSPN